MGVMRGREVEDGGGSKYVKAGVLGSGARWGGGVVGGVRTMMRMRIGGEWYM